jgi:hypothetical protein
MNQQRLLHQSVLAPWASSCYGGGVAGIGEECPKQLMYSSPVATQPCTRTRLKWRFEVGYGRRFRDSRRRRWRATKYFLWICASLFGLHFYSKFHQRLQVPIRFSTHIHGGQRWTYVYSFSLAVNISVNLTCYSKYFRFYFGIFLTLDLGYTCMFSSSLNLLGLKPVGSTKVSYLLVTLC